MQETKSNWAVVTELMKNQPSITLGRYASYWYYKTPRRMLHSQSYYKFASKLIGKGKRILDIGCNEGLGTYLMARECGYAKGIDFDHEAIQTAQNNFKDPSIQFSVEDILLSPITELYDAIVSFDVIEHIYPEHVEGFFSAIKARLKPEGICFIGTPSLISQQFASEVSKKGHVNVYAPERLQAEMERHFTFAFQFAANDEVVHTGYLPLSHYLIAIGSKKKI